MDKTDEQLIHALRHNGRASLSELADILKITRATVRSRLDRLQRAGEIVGFTAILRSDANHAPVRGMMMIAIEGRGTERVIRQLTALPAIESLHTTNGKWDLIAEIGAQSLEQLDGILRDIRLLDGVATSETNLLLSTRKLAKARSV